MLNQRICNGTGSPPAGYLTIRISLNIFSFYFVRSKGFNQTNCRKLNFAHVVTYALIFGKTFLCPDHISSSSVERLIYGFSSITKSITRYTMSCQCPCKHIPSSDRFQAFSGPVCRLSSFLVCFYVALAN